MLISQPEHLSDIERLTTERGMRLGRYGAAPKVARKLMQLIIGRYGFEIVAAIPKTSQPLQAFQESVPDFQTVSGCLAAAPEIPERVRISRSRSEARGAAPKRRQSF
jgi:hypothetical protein